MNARRAPARPPAASTRPDGIRLLMLSYEFPPLGGGGAGVVSGLSKQLALQGHEVDVVTMGYKHLPRFERTDGVNVHRVPCVRLRKTYCTMPELGTYIVSVLPLALRLIRTREHHLNHTHFIFPDGVISLLLRRFTGLPYLVTTHGSDVPGYNPDRFRLAHRFLAPAWRRIVSGAERIVCPSESLKGLVLKAMPDAPATVVPNGISVDRFRSDLLKEKRILVVTRMFERKGVQYFLRALKGLELDHEVHIVGDGPYLERLKALARDLGLEVRFWGWLDGDSEELVRLYETSDIYVFPSEAENFPVVLLEAMSAGMAIITTRGTGCAEVVGDAALLVEPRNADAIRAALLRLVGDPELCTRLGQAARNRLAQNFGWPAVTHRYTDHYLQCARTT